MRAFTFFDLAFLGGVSLNAPDCDPGLSADGGGDTFECYPVNDYLSLAFPSAGVGFAGVFQKGNSTFQNVNGDSFDSYAVAFTGTMSADEDLSGSLETAFSGSWVTMDDFSAVGDNLNSYTVEDPLVQTLNAGTGFSAAWEYGSTVETYDDFNSYTVEDPLAQTLNAGVGFSAAWEYGDAPIYWDNLNSYTVEDPLAQTMNSGTGFSAAWEYGDV